MQARWMAYPKLPLRMLQLLFGLCLLSNAVWSSTDISDEKLLHNLLQNYSRSTRPAPEGGPVIVTVGMYILGVSSINVVDMDFILNVYLRQSWNDPRLKYAARNHSTVLTVDHNSINSFWLPDLFFPSEKSSKLSKVPVPNKGMAIKPNGDIFYSQKMSLQLACDLKLQAYPLDKQVCKVKLESYAFTTRDLMSRWYNTTTEQFSPVELGNEVPLPEFNITGTVTGDCSATYTSGTYPCIFVEICLLRDLGFYITQTFLPSSLFVVLSWLSFWLDPDAVPGRISLGLLTVLTLTTQTSSVTALLPKVSYVKAIDVWMAVCQVFVFGALIEFSVVNVLSRRHKANKSTIKNQQSENEKHEANQNKSNGNIVIIAVENGSYATDKETNQYEHSVSENANRSICHTFSTWTCNWRNANEREKAKCLDRVSRFVFPLIFISFNVFYWIYFSKQRRELDV